MIVSAVEWEEGGRGEEARERQRVRLVIGRRERNER